MHQAVPSFIQLFPINVLLLQANLTPITLITEICFQALFTTVPTSIFLHLLGLFKTINTYVYQYQVESSLLFQLFPVFNLNPNRNLAPFLVIVPIVLS